MDYFDKFPNLSGGGGGGGGGGGQDPKWWNTGPLLGSNWFSDWTPILVDHITSYSPILGHNWF